MILSSDKITYSSPGRCGFAGNPADIYGGSVISCTIVERVFISVEDNDILELVVECNVRRVSVPKDYIQDNGIFDAILSVIKYFDMGDAKIKITIRSDIPISAGFSGATAIITALVTVLLEWMNKNDFKTNEKTMWRKNTPLDKYILAETVRHIELYFLKIVCGYQDAYMCSFGSLSFLDLRDKENCLSLKCVSL